MGFIFPALIIMVLQRKPKWTHTMKRVISATIVALGLLLFINGFAVLGFSQR